MLSRLSCTIMQGWWGWGMVCSQSPGQQVFIKKQSRSLQPWAGADPRRKSLLCLLARPEQSQAHTQSQPGGLHLSGGQVEDVSSFLPVLIFGLELCASIPYSCRDCVSPPIPVQELQAVHWQTRGAAGELTDSWQQGLFLSPIWPDRSLKAKGSESNDPL